ncbi:MAG TPA: DEAD/DEAH box helicase [Polyangia bacterium]|jgi:superfamily II DNA or RNA helicase|nr:DEAD/DEAH box helicase [Polyangia bacterium]
MRLLRSEEPPLFSTSSPAVPHASGPKSEKSDGPRLRPWQRTALAQLEASASSNFLAVATPGAGKTTFALTAARRALVARSARRVVIVVPTEHLKHQWAQAAERLDIHLDPEWSVGYGGLPSDVHGVVVTYQQVAIDPSAFRPMVRQAFVVLDEVHHAGDSRSWGDGVRMAFDPAWRRLCLSGTPFRSDEMTIPFITYEGELAQPDFEYGFGDALKDGQVVRPVYFPRINGRMEWTAPDGVSYEATFDDRLARELASQRLRTALDGSGEWLPSVIAQAHAQLMHLRNQDPSAAGLAIAIDQEHAKAIAEIMRERLGIVPTIATSDDPGASEKIGRFAAGIAPWIVAVRMVSEGVDIPRLRVGVFATNTTTELFFRQAVGRLVRWNARLRRQAAYMFIPDDIRLRTFANAIAEQRRHSLRKDRKDDDRFEGGEPPVKKTETERDLSEQLSLFAAISAVPLDERGQPLDEARIHEAQNEAQNDLDDGPDDGIPDLVDGTEIAVAPANAARPAVVPLPEVELAPLAPPKTGALARRRQLRELNSEAVRDLVHLTGKTHAELNSELNRKVGVKRIGLATVRQLEQRLVVAKSWTKRR